MLRNYGNLVGIDAICGGFVSLNKAKARRLLMLSHQAFALFDQRDLDSQISAAVKNASRQAGVMGLRPWCLDQRKRWRALPGGDELFP